MCQDNNQQKITIIGDKNEPVSFNETDVKMMYNRLLSVYFSSQSNGMAYLDSDDRASLKRLLKLPDNYR